MFKAQNLSQLKHAFFSRRGGVSTGYFDSLNFAFTKGDNSENIKENQKTALEKLAIPNIPLILCEQVHSTKVVTIKEPITYIHKADAIVTQNPYIAIGILSADCVPILLADYTTRIIGVTHAGWRGAKAGIISNTINTMIGLGATLENIQAAIGPCIAQKSYEVGPEIFQTFTEAYP